MYRKIADAIRQSDAVHLILFQGVTWEVVLPIGEECVSMQNEIIVALPPRPIAAIRHPQCDVQHTRRFSRTASHRCFRYGFTEVPGGAAWANKSVRF